jgi:hypothetical protein
MAEPRKPTQTQTLEAYTPASNAPPKSGKRSDDDRRGLAAFDRGAPVAPSHPQKGSLRWGAGGGESLPPPKAAKAHPRQHEDDDLLRDRVSARMRDDDDDGEMVAVSASDWGDVMAPTPTPRGRGRKAAPEPEEEVEVEGEEAPPKKRGSAWKWVVGVLLLLGVGGGAAWGIAALNAPAEPAALADTKPVADKDESDDEAAAAAEPDPEEGATKEPATKEAATPATKEPEAPDADMAEPDATAAAAVEPTAEKPNLAPVIGLAAWAPAALAKNPWVEVPAAPSGQRLGLRDDELGGSLLSLRTGFRPDAKVFAPTRGYRLQAHEVTWAEVALASTLPDLADLATAPRPSWLPKSAARAASLPATGLTWAHARAFCQSLGGDLPSEAEWEWAARGTDDRYFPWGREAIDAGKAHIVASGGVPVVAVATSPLDQTPPPVVLADLLGNAQEWTRDPWSPSDPSTGADPKAATHKAVRGWPLLAPGESAPAEGTTYRAAGCAHASCQTGETNESKALARIGFRCAHPL